MKFLIVSVCVLFAFTAAELQWDQNGQYRLVETAPLKSAVAPFPYPYPGGYPYPSYPYSGYPYPGVRYMNLAAPQYNAAYPYPGVRYMNLAAPEYSTAIGSAPFTYSYIQKKSA